jgi:hypothetical protein
MDSVRHEDNTHICCFEGPSVLRIIEVSLQDLAAITSTHLATLVEVLADLFNESELFVVRW